MASILRQVQDQVAAQLRESEALSACPVYAEDQKDLEFQIKNALGRQGLVIVVTTPKATYMGKLDDTSVAWQLDQLEIDCVENVPVNRGKKEGYLTGQEAAMKVFDVLCPLDGPQEGQICPVSYEQGQDSGLLVSRCVLKCLVTGDETPGPGPQPQIKKWFVRLLEEAPAEGTALQNGWMWQTEDGFAVVKDGVAYNLGVSFDQMSSYVDSRISSVLPTTDVTLSSAWHLSPWDGDRKMVQELVFSPDGGIVETPTGDYWACDRLELTKDGQPTELVLTIEKQYNVDGEGNMTVQSPAAAFNPNPYIVEVGNKSLELWFKIDGQGVYGVQVFDAQDHALVAEQPDHQQYSFCDLEFDYNGSHFALKAKKSYKLLIPASEFIRDSMASNPGWDFYNLMSQMYLPLSGGQVNGNLSVGTGVELFNEADGGVVRISNGNANETFYQHNKIGTPNGNLYYPVSIPEQDEVVATREWTSRNYTKISAMTEDEYEQITPDPTTLYVITED